MPVCYDAVNPQVLALVRADSRRVLDVGCGMGGLGRALKEARAREVVGITFSEEEACIATQVLDCVIVRDLDAMSLAELGTFDSIICSHVLEHLRSPSDVLRSLQGCLAPGGQLIVALPNVLYVTQRLEFLRGRFRYTDYGVMDRTHVHFFDWQTARELVQDAGYRIIEARAHGYLPQPIFRRLFPALAGRLDRLAAAAFPGLFGVQFVIDCSSEV